MKTPLDTLLDRADWRCAICKAKAGTCACWEKCECGAHFERGARCRNPKHRDPPRDVDCPHCGSKAGSVCVMGKTPLAYTHKRRDRLSERGVSA